MVCTGRERAGLACMGSPRWRSSRPSCVLAPPSHWDQPLLLAVLLRARDAAIFHDVPLPSGISFDATAALALIAVALVGPLPALADHLPADRRSTRCAAASACCAPATWRTSPPTAGTRSPARCCCRPFAPDPTAPQALAWLFVAGAGPAARQLGGRPRRLRHAVARPPAARARRDAARRAARRPWRWRRSARSRWCSTARSGCWRSRCSRSSPCCRRARSRSSPARARSRCSIRSPRRAATRARWRCTSGSAARERRELDAVIRLAHARGVTGDPGEHLGAHRRRLERGLVRRRPRHGVVERRRRAGRRARRDHPAVGADRRGRAHLGGADRRRGARGSATSRRSRTSTARPACGSTRRVVRAARAVVAQERLSPAVPAPEPRLHHLHVPEPLRRALAASV